MSTQTYLVNRVYQGVQGSGILRGAPSVFIQLAKNDPSLRNRISELGRSDPEDFILFDIDSLVATVRKHRSVRNLIICGEDPTEQFTAPFCKKMHENEWKIAVEIDGKVFPASIIPYIETCSFLPNLLELNDKPNPKIADNVVQAVECGVVAEVRFVVGEERELELSKKIIRSIVDQAGYPHEYDGRLCFSVQPRESERYYTEETLKNYKNLVKKFLNDPLFNKSDLKFGLSDNKVFGI